MITVYKACSRRKRNASDAVAYHFIVVPVAAKSATVTALQNAWVNAPPGFGVISIEVREYQRWYYLLIFPIIIPPAP